MFLPLGLRKCLTLPLDHTARLGFRTGSKLGEVLIHELQTLGNVVISREVDAGVGRMVELSVKVSELLEGQIGNDSGVSTTVNTISIVRKDTPLGFSHEERVRAGIHTLHLIVHHPLVGEWLTLVLQFQVPTLLGVDLWVRGCARMEDSISIDVHQVVEILCVLTGNDVARPVRVREGVEESLKGALEKLHKGILGGVFAGTTQHTVFQDVRDSRRVGRWCAEGDAKHLVVVIAGHRQQFCA
mmetsp:Transcript_7733/g.13972  ORF Transcript_7733/g.13972 Transcript_7733/m.13972 type:complete len:242 (+) Transcript_7733:2391-3116(+)